MIIAASCMRRFAETAIALMGVMSSKARTNRVIPVRSTDAGGFSFEGFRSAGLFSCCCRIPDSTAYMEFILEPGGVYL